MHRRRPAFSWRYSLAPARTRGPFCLLLLLAKLRRRECAPYCTSPIRDGKRSPACNRRSISITAWLHRPPCCKKTRRQDVGGRPRFRNQLSGIQESVVRNQVSVRELG